MRLPLPAIRALATLVTFASLNALLPARSLAQAPAAAKGVSLPAPGQYVTRGSWAGLDIDAQGRFTLESISGRGLHQCHLEGRIEVRREVRIEGRSEGHRARLAEGCVVAFDPTADGIDVRDASPRAGACHIYCGANGGFEGEYFRPRPACSDKALDQARARATADYRAGRLGAAEARLKQSLAACRRFITLDRAYGLLNDLALAQHRAGRSAECLATLRPVMPDLVADPEAALAGMRREDDEEEYRYLRTQAQMRFNWKLCGGS